MAHDIRSPLAVLKAVFIGTADLTEKERTLVGNAISRIKNIANDMVQEDDSNEVNINREKDLRNNKRMACSLYILTKEIVEEKQIQYAQESEIAISAKYDSAANIMYADVDPLEYKRILSNLIDNAAEAIENGGAVEVMLSVIDKCLQLVIKDNGRGIPDHILPNLKQRGW